MLHDTNCRSFLRRCSEISQINYDLRTVPPHTEVFLQRQWLGAKLDLRCARYLFKTRTCPFWLTAYLTNDKIYTLMYALFIVFKWLYIGKQPVQYLAQILNDTTKTRKVAAFNSTIIALFQKSDKSNGSPHTFLFVIRYYFARHFNLHVKLKFDILYIPTQTRSMININIFKVVNWLYQLV